MPHKLQFLRKPHHAAYQMKGFELNNKNKQLKYISGETQTKYLVNTLFAGVAGIVPDNEKHHNKENP